MRSARNCSCGIPFSSRGGWVKSKPSGTTVLMVSSRSAVGDSHLLDAVHPGAAELAGRSQQGDPGRPIGQGVEDQLDLEPGEVGADAVVRAVPTERLVRVGVTQHVERERVLEDVVVEVGAGVEQADAVAL